MKVLLALLLLAPGLAAQPQVIYSKLFPGSVPEWVQITLHQDGQAAQGTTLHTSGETWRSAD